MTMQKTDILLFNDAEYHVSDSTRTYLFEPKDYGLNPYTCVTSCYRGWKARYAISERLRLQDLWVSHDAGHPVKNRKPNGPEIEGVLPQESTDSDDLKSFNCYYPQINIDLGFSGAIIIGKNSLKLRARHLPFWVFEQVFELVVEQGKLISAKDKSYLAERVRQSYIGNNSLGYVVFNPTGKDIKWLTDSFVTQLRV